MTNGGFGNATLISIIEDHITKVLTHYKGRCYAWDVANEGDSNQCPSVRLVADDVAAVWDNSTWRESVSYDTIRPPCIPIAFAAAAKADPDAKLYYSDFAIEVPGPKVDATVTIVKMIQDYGVKIDGVGLQGHVDLSGQPPEAHFELGSYPSYDDLVIAMKQ